MSWEYDEEFYKEYTRKTWNQSVEAYQAWIRALEPFNEPLLDGLDLQAGPRVLDVATGPGEPALTIARSLGSQGEVLGIDLADEMIDHARRSAKKKGVHGVSFEVMDAEDMTLEDETFDAAVCRSSLQILTRPSAALEEIARVLKPGGRFTASVWADPGERSPALHAMIGPMLMFCTPDDTGYIPTPYELGGPGTLTEMAERAGLEVLEENRMRTALTFEDRDAYLEAVLNGTPVGHSLEEERQEVQEAVMQETHANLDRWIEESAEGIHLDGEVVTIQAQRPS